MTMKPNEEIKKFIKGMKAFEQSTLEQTALDDFNMTQLLQLIEASKQLIHTSENIISELDNN